MRPLKRARPVRPAPAGEPLAVATGILHAGRTAKPPRRRSRALRAISALLMAAGLLALADAATTMLWQEPISAIYASLEQSELNDSLHALESAPTSAPLTSRLKLLHSQSQRIALLASQLERSAPSGSAVGRLAIPRIGADFALVNGTSTTDLQAGPGIYSKREYPSSRFPGRPGVTSIAGHRTTFLAPFRHIDRLRAGNPIILTMPYGRFEYKVQRTLLISPADVRAATHPGGGTQLVLSSCFPEFSASQRILVYARLASVSPRGAAAQYVQRLLDRAYPSSRLATEIGLPGRGFNAGI